MKLSRRYRRDCLRLRADNVARLERSIVIGCGGFLVSRIDNACLVWRRSKRTGRPVIVSAWRYYQSALRSMQHAANVAARMKQMEARHAT